MQLKTLLPLIDFFQIALPTRSHQQSWSDYIDDPTGLHYDLLWSRSRKFYHPVTEPLVNLRRRITHDMTFYCALCHKTQLSYVACHNYQYAPCCFIPIHFKASCIRSYFVGSKCMFCAMEYDLKHLPDESDLTDTAKFLRINVFIWIVLP